MKVDIAEINDINLQLSRQFLLAASWCMNVYRPLWLVDVSHVEVCLLFSHGQ